MQLQRIAALIIVLLSQTACGAFYGRQARTAKFTVVNDTDAPLAVNYQMGKLADWQSGSDEVPAHSSRTVEIDYKERTQFSGCGDPETEYCGACMDLGTASFDEGVDPLFAGTLTCTDEGCTRDGGKPVGAARYGGCADRYHPAPEVDEGSCKLRAGSSCID